MDRTIRVRSVVWFALGVVTALFAMLLVARSWSASAATEADDATTFVPVEPCRLFDFRPAPFTVGNRTVPLSPGETYVQQVTGQVGDCSLPADATAVAMNVTITEPTEASYLTLFPANVATVPTVSSLNWVAGQAPTPNKVDVALSPTGRIKLYNRFGQVFVLADAVGYYTTTALDDIRTELAERYHPLRYGYSNPGDTYPVGSDWSTIAYIRWALDGPGLPGGMIAANFTVVVPGDREVVRCVVGWADRSWLPPGWWEEHEHSGTGWAEWQSPTGGGRTHLTIMNPNGLLGPGSMTDPTVKLMCRNVDGGTATIKNLTLSHQSADFGYYDYSLR